MCGRFYIATEDAALEIRALLNEIYKREQENQPKLGEVFPTENALVVANSRKAEARPFVMRWGYTTGDGKRTIINARCETAADKPMFRESFRLRRLLVPSTGYFEWEKRDGERVKYLISDRSGCTFLAGLYRPTRVGELAEFVILTRQASENIRFIHDRMPVMFSHDAAAAWLSTSADPLRVIEMSSQNPEYRLAASM